MTVKASDVPGSSSGGGSGFGSTPDPVLGNGSGPTQNSFTYFPMYVLDVNNGVVLFPGVDQLAEPAASVYLQAQVSGTTVSSYNWITSGITSDAKNITGASTYQLSFQWNSLINTSHVDAITLAVTDTNSHTETYTYDFDLQSGNSSSSGGSELTWPQSYAPDTVSPDDPAWASDGVSVDSNSGSLDTSIALPSYNPNVAANALDYDSISANPLPVIVAENTLSASQAVPSQVKRHPDLQFDRRYDLLLQHQHPQSRRRAADRAPGHRRVNAGHRPLQLLGPDRRPRDRPHHHHRERHRHADQPVEQPAWRRLEPGRARADHPRDEQRRLDPQPGRRKQSLVHRQLRQRRRHLHQPARPV